MRQTVKPSSAKAAPRLTVVVVLPTPPFWFMRAMIRILDWVLCPWSLVICQKCPQASSPLGKGLATRCEEQMTNDEGQAEDKKRNLPPWRGRFLCVSGPVIFGAKAQNG